MSDVDGSTYAGPSRHDSPSGKVVKRTRQTQSCDACRRRKVRCDRAIDSEAPCSNCRMIDESCTFSRTPRKRGPTERNVHSPRPHKVVPPKQRPYAADDEAYWTPVPGEPPDTTTRAPVPRAISPQQSTNSTGSGPLRLLPVSSSSRGLPQQYPNFPHNPNNVFDNTLPRGLFYLVIDHFFDYLHALNPFVHRPTFLRDILDRREENVGQEEWVAMVLAIVALTILQLPPSFVPAPVSESRRIAYTCYRHAKGYSLKDYEHLSLDRQVLNYVTSSIMALLGLKTAASSARFANVGALGILRLNEEYESYAAYPPLEREMRRRIFWLVFGGDQTLAVIHSAPVCFHPDETDTALPLILDDEYLTPEGQIDQPADHQVVMAGFHYISKIFLLASRVLEFRRRDRRYPPHGSALRDRIAEIEGFYEAILRVMDDCPPSLKLGPARSPASERGIQSDLEGFYADGPYLSPAKNSFLAQQANLYVSQQLYRYVTLEYLQHLYTLQEHDLDQTPLQRAVTVTTELVAQDLLTVLHSLPIEAIAVNSISIVLKVRYVACGLLDAGEISETGPSPDQGVNGRRAENSLLDFVDILAKLDKINRITDGW